jgi:hypothetical protein
MKMVVILLSRVFQGTTQGIRNEQVFVNPQDGAPRRLRYGVQKPNVLFEAKFRRLAAFFVAMVNCKKNCGPGDFADSACVAQILGSWLRQGTKAREERSGKGK